MIILSIDEIHGYAPGRVRVRQFDFSPAKVLSSTLHPLWCMVRHVDSAILKARRVRVGEFEFLLGLM